MYIRRGCNHKFILCGCSAVHEHLLLMAIFGRSGGSDKERASRKGQNSAGDDRHETNSVSMNTQLWGVLYIPLPRQGRAHVLPHIPAKKHGSEGGRKRGNKAKSGSSHFPLSPSAQYIYMYSPRACIGISSTQR